MSEMKELERAEAEIADLWAKVAQLEAERDQWRKDFHAAVDCEHQNLKRAEAAEQIVSLAQEWKRAQVELWAARSTFTERQVQAAADAKDALFAVLT